MMREIRIYPRRYVGCDDGNLARDTTVVTRRVGLLLDTGMNDVTKYPNWRNTWWCWPGLDKKNFHGSQAGEISRCPKDWPSVGTNVVNLF